MALNIRNPDADRLAEELARVTGETRTEAVIRAMRERMDRVRRERGGTWLVDELDEMARACTALPVGSRSARCRGDPGLRRARPSALMVIDTSALVAVFQDEPERHTFNEAIEGAESRLLSVANWVETSIVIEVRCGTAGLHLLDRFLDRAAIECVPVDLRQVQ